MTASKNFKGSAGHSGLLETALSYAVRGWSVIRLRGMVPAIAKNTDGHGIHDATTDAAIMNQRAVAASRFKAYIATSCQLQRTLMRSVPYVGASIRG